MWYHFDLKLQKQTAYKLESGVAQYKYVVTIPEPIIEELGWNEGSELMASVSGRSLVMNRISSPVKQQRKVESAKMTYDQFRDKIRRALQYNDLGMTWTRLRNHLELEQVVQADGERHRPDASKRIRWSDPLASESCKVRKL